MTTHRHPTLGLARHDPHPRRPHAVLYPPSLITELNRLARLLGIRSNQITTWDDRAINHRATVA